MSFTDISYEETPKFQRVDLTPYREVFSNLREGLTATIPVPTNDPDSGTTWEDHVRNFRKVATERNVGLRVGKTHLPNGTTRLRLMVDKKREFTQAAQVKRDLALLKGRINKKVRALMVDNPTWTQETAQKHYLDNNKEQATKLRELTKQAGAS